MSLEQHLKDTDGDHYCFITPTYYKVSTGSIKLDAALEGGHGPGIIRKAGSSEGGKTASSLEEVSNFLETIPNSKAIYFKCEGRLGKKMINRNALNFTSDAKEWDSPAGVGKCYIYKGNIFDNIAQFIYDTVTNNPHDYKYAFIIDSMDGLILRADMKKSMDGDESVKVAGPQVLTKLLFKKVSIPVNELGHQIFILAQVTAKIESKYDKKEQMDVGGGGGNAQVHFANICLEYLPRSNGDLITSDGTSPKFDFEENNIVGHWVKVKIKKSENEITGTVIKYPIKYGTNGKSAVWVELEIRSMLEYYGLLTIKGRSNAFSDAFREKLKEVTKGDVPEKFGSGKACLEYLIEPTILTATKKILKEMSENDNLEL